MHGTKSPTEKSSSKGGNANEGSQHEKTDKDSHPVDEYYGNYKSACDGVSDDQKWGHNQNPVKNDQLPAKGLRSYGPA